jgi:two-component system sensor histidine kinase/response regulator
LAIVRHSRPAIGAGTVEMGLLANFKIRTKVFIALLPLAVMVIVATLYSSIEMKRIDTWYSNLIDRDIKAQQDLTAARALGRL